LSWSRGIYESRLGELFVAGARDRDSWYLNRFDGRNLRH
jgi:hypothetical protein